MRVLTLTISVLVVTAVPGAIRPDVAGWMVLATISIFLGILDIHQAAFSSSVSYRLDRALERRQLDEK